MIKFLTRAYVVPAVCLLALAACGREDVPVAAPQVPDTPVEAMLTVTQSLANNQPGVIWNALPGSYQQDVRTLIHDFANRVDPDIYDQSFAVVNKVGDVLRTQKQYLLASPMAQDGMMSQEDVASSLDLIVDMIQTVTSSELGSVAGLRKMDPSRFLNTTGARLMQQASELSKPFNDGVPFTAELASFQFELVSQDGDQATLRVVEPDGRTQEDTVTRVEGKWLPTDMTQEWSQTMADARQAIAEMTSPENKVQILALLAGVNAALDVVQQADSQEAFDQAAEQLGNMIFMMMLGM